MSDWMPSTEQVRSHYVFDQTDQWDRARGEAFDRWLAAHDAEIREAGRLAALEEAEKAKAAIERIYAMALEDDAAAWDAHQGLIHRIAFAALRSSSPYRADQDGEQP